MNTVCVHPSGYFLIGHSYGISIFEDIHQKEPQSFSAVDAQLLFLPLQTEYYDRGCGQEPNGNFYGLYTKGCLFMNT